MGQSGYLLIPNSNGIPSPTGGILTYNGTSGTYQLPYGYSGGSYGGGAGGNISASCQGPTIWTWKWAGIGPPPDCVIVTINCSAGYNSVSGGTCDDGYGDQVNLLRVPPPANSVYGATTSGTHYVIYNNPGLQFSLQLSPSSSVNSGSCSVGVSMLPTDVVVSMNGGLYPQSAQDECLPGQYLNASISAGAFITSMSKPIWNISGPTALPQAPPNWGGSSPVINSQTQSSYPPVHQWMGYLKQFTATQTPSFFWPVPGNSTAQCTATAYAPGGIAIGQITGHHDISVKEVQHDLYAWFGTTCMPFYIGMGGVVSNNPLYVSASGPGMGLAIYAVTPPEFNYPPPYLSEGMGQVMPVQLVNINSSEGGYLEALSWLVMSQNSNGIALDNVFPYGSPVVAYTHPPLRWPTSSPLWSDSPTVGLMPPFTIPEWIQINFQFQMFSVFQGPQVSGVPQPEFIPIQVMDWNWQPSSASPWTGTLSPPTPIGRFDWPTTNFQWQSLYSNTGLLSLKRGHSK